MRNMLEMKSKVLFLFLLWINFSLGTSFANGLSIIPQPQSLSFDEGSVELENKIVVFYSTALKQEAEFLKTYLKQDFSAEVVFSKRERRADIVLRLDKDFPSQNKEGYSIDATDKKVVIKARSAAGIFLWYSDASSVFRKAVGQVISSESQNRRLSGVFLACFYAG